MSRGAFLFWFTAIGVGMTALFWWPFWTGGGLVGTDIYAYFLPQKQFYAEQLATGSLPLWNDRVAFGYPIVGESQTGVFYPPHLLFYSLLDAHMAYHANQLFHYALAFVAVALLARRLGIGFWGTILASVVYVYGWFPVRICLEWPIIGGAYLPLGLWCAESFLRQKKLKWLLLLSLVLAMQMLAGHFQLAFITQLAVALWVIGRATVFREKGEATIGKRVATGVAVVPAMLAGFALAAVQLWPTWELKQHSQRTADASLEFNPAADHIPPGYLAQVAASWWLWHSPDVDRDKLLREMEWARVEAPTNQVEAHLYFGLLPLLFLVLSFFRPKEWGGSFWLLLVMALVGLFFATGWPIVWLRDAPGFSYFKGPGRFGILTTLGVALIAGKWLHGWLKRGTSDRVFVAFAIIGLVCWDLKYVARAVGTYPGQGYAQIVNDPPFAKIADSNVRKQLLEFKQTHGPSRVLAPMANLLTLLGTSQVQAGEALGYLGLGPAAYWDAKHRFPKPTDPKRWGDAQIEWLRKHGVTHVLRTEQLEFPTDATQLVFQGKDPFLSRFLGGKLFLYEVRNSFLATDQSGKAVSFAAKSPTAATIEVQSNSTATWKELSFPGWTADVDSTDTDSLFRTVNVTDDAKKVWWEYSPRSVLYGAIVSIASLLMWIVLVILLRKKRKAGPK